jgi:hypothetical protein
MDEVQADRSFGNFFITVFGVCANVVPLHDFLILCAQTMVNQIELFRN